ncbi:isopeptide-forming domain-containing fimbrial protein [Bifidobacterium vespertilionis]|uniref:Isopeptide-forming domain-containing fimbrial protein n=1 Tax=Bifidobacterium vespertilionis TaxID=2562524 RepID=A0A5J5DXH0_9BIFI|nr:isopeptide-forming domain-containing fimbrial protein [Bifidobacterium vespertilionis]KAA8816219.1 isopeptide-forming domain-containing fimbrial protein [Bifidobacterium vespertilionis]KAA8821555.1 isopeptide-forming domain-containing fimbrial protein [Bifidobacterium vespertilionis]
MRNHTIATIQTIIRAGARTVAAGLAAAAATAVALAGLTAPAMAIGHDDTATITINNVEPGAVVTVHKVIDVHYDFDANRPIQPQYTWVGGVAEWVKANHAGYADDAGAVADPYADLEDDPVADPANATDIATFADGLSAAIAQGTATAEAAGEKTVGEQDDSAVFNLPMGGYLIHITNGTYVYRAVMASIAPGLDDPKAGWQLKPVTIDAKRSLPGIDKSVNEQTEGHVSGRGSKGTGSDSAGIGETVTFDLRADVPVFPAKALSKRFVIADRLDAGLTLNPDSIAVYGSAGRTGGQDNGGQADSGETKLESDAYGLTVTDAKDLDGNPVSFLVDLGGDHYASVRGFKTVHVRYTATVNKSAVIGPGGNRNEVKLQYSNNPYKAEGHRNEDDEVVVYAYGLRLLKTGASGEPLTGVTFSLATVDGQALQVVEVDGVKGHYRMPEPGETGDAGDAGESGAPGGIVLVDELAVSSDLANLGRLTIDGLDQGGYTLTEQQAPDGYVIASTAVSFTITDTGATGDGSGELTGSVANEEKGHPGYAFGSVANFRGGLPNTGGVGTVMFVAVGLLLVSGGMILIATRIRRNGPARA